LLIISVNCSLVGKAHSEFARPALRYPLPKPARFFTAAVTNRAAQGSGYSTAVRVNCLRRLADKLQFMAQI